jgi:RNA polymerase primary sigma factor
MGIMKSEARPTSADSLSLYLKELEKASLLTHEEEVSCARAARAGDAAARQRLIQANLRFVVMIARQHLHRGLPLEDLINEGNIGLMRAAERFDPERGIRFISYAVWWVRQSMTRAIQSGGRMIRQPDVREDSERTILDTVSLESTGSGGEDSSSLLSRLEDTSVRSPEQSLTDNALRRGIDSALHGLSSREAHILSDRFGLEDRSPLSLEEMGRRYRLSRERIRQIEKKAIAKLRRAGAMQDLRSYVGGRAKAFVA